FTHTGYELGVHMAALPSNKVIYGYSKDYELQVLDGEGRHVMTINVDTPRPQFVAEELTDYKRFDMPSPEFKPYFYRIMSDSEGRIYVQRTQNLEGIRGYGPLERKEEAGDVFGADGCFLYRIQLPPNTAVIRDGFLYTRSLDEEEGTEYVHRYKIRNWGDIKKEK
ncbi:MAG: hypothetical protein MUP70_03960, partial [Candidatus Aminicenantes bacterium]|nr:hypothetical protein [Candidatus Aminicenantes bacterium]